MKQRNENIVITPKRDYITVMNGNAKAIIQDIHVYCDMQESLALLKIHAGSSKQKKTRSNLPKKFLKVFTTVFPEMGKYPPELERIKLYTSREIHSNPNRILYEVIDETIKFTASLGGEEMPC